MKTIKFFEQLEDKPIHIAPEIKSPHYVFDQIIRDTTRMKNTQGWDEHSEFYLNVMKGYLQELERMFKKKEG